MTPLRTGLAAFALSAALGLGAVAGVSRLTADESAVAQTTIPACTQVTASGGMVNDPCAAEVALWQQANRNALGTMPFYAKWKAANPGELSRLRAWSTSPSSTPEPIVATSMGAIVRYGLTQCRKWTLDVTQCALP